LSRREGQWLYRVDGLYWFGLNALERVWYIRSQIHLRQKEVQMANWKQLEKDISKWLSTFASANIRFCNSHQAIAGFPSHGFRNDGMLANDRVLIAVEVEAGQMHPDTNVGKYWLLYAEYKQYQKIVLFHVYTPDFDSYDWRKKLGEFYARQMRESSN
jgi:hypothetical protein